MRNPNFRKLAQKFSVESDNGRLSGIVSALEEQLALLPGGKADAVEQVLVDFLENALQDEFGLQCEIEGAWTEDDANETLARGGK